MTYLASPSKPSRFALVVGVHLLLWREDLLLLGRRVGTGYADGLWHVPGGHLEGGESVLAAACREADEELGIRVEEKDLSLAHIVHDTSSSNRLQVFFDVQRWNGEIVNREPHKCAELAWHAPQTLPREIVPYLGHTLDQLSQGVRFSLFGWSEKTEAASFLG
jgi:8-oxo-dGTP diphosphatase